MSTNDFSWLVLILTSDQHDFDRGYGGDDANNRILEIPPYIVGDTMIKNGVPYWCNCRFRATFLCSMSSNHFFHCMYIDSQIRILTADKMVQLCHPDGTGAGDSFYSCWNDDDR